MQINITGHQMDVTPALKHFTEEKLHKLEHHFTKITTINVIFNVEKKLRQIVSVNVLLSSGEQMQASDEAENMYAAIDVVVDKLNKQLQKNKEKIIGHRADKIHNNNQEEFRE